MLAFVYDPAVTAVLVKATVTAPVYGPDPVPDTVTPVPAATDVTPPLLACHAGTPATKVNTYPLAEAESLDKTFVALAYKRSPVV